MASRWYQAGARISKRDICDLDEASENLALAARTIQQLGPKWQEPVVALLIKANDTVVRLQQKGSTAFARYFQKHPEQEAAQATEAVEVAGEPASEQNVEQEKE